MRQTVNDFFTAGNHIITDAQITANSFDYFGEDGIITVSELEKVIKLKYGFSTLIPATAAQIQDSVVSVLIMNRMKYDRWQEDLKLVLPALQTYKRSEMLDRTEDTTIIKSEADSKTNTGSQTVGNQSSDTRTDNLSEATIHGLTQTHARNAYDSATMVNDDRTTNSGTDTINNTGTQTNSSSSTTARTDDLSEARTHTANNSDGVVIDSDKNVIGYDGIPTEIFAKKLEYYARSFVERMADDICSYITFFDFDFGA